jgi:ribosomal protein S18 acetylase RimI-like enzyme
MLEIRPFRAVDEPLIVALWEQCGLIRPWNDPRKDIARKLSVQPELFLVGTEHERLVATVMAGYEGHRGWVNYLAVAPAFRGKGYGRALMHRVEELLLSLGCPKVSLLVRFSNPEALEFYRHIGYVQDEAVALGKRLIQDRPSR